MSLREAPSPQPPAGGAKGPSLTGVSFPDFTVHRLRALCSQTWKGTKHRSTTASGHQVSSLLKQEIVGGSQARLYPTTHPTSAHLQEPLESLSLLSLGHFPALEDHGPSSITLSLEV